MKRSPAERIWSSVSMTSSLTCLAFPLTTTAIRALGGGVLAGREPEPLGRETGTLGIDGRSPGVVVAARGFVPPGSGEGLRAMRPTLYHGRPTARSESATYRPISVSCWT